MVITLSVRSWLQIQTCYLRLSFRIHYLLHDNLRLALSSASHSLVGQVSNLFKKRNHFAFNTAAFHWWQALPDAATIGFGD